MTKRTSIWPFLLFISFISCSSPNNHHLRGEYFCSDSNPKSEPSEPVKIALKASGDNCVYKSLNFTSDKTVIMLKDIINGQRIEYPMTYQREGNVITIPHPEGVDLILKVESSSKIIGEGLAYGVYEK